MTFADSPALRSPGFFCPHCGLFAHMGWADVWIQGRAGKGFVRLRDEPVEMADPEGGMMTRWVGEWSVATCYACGDVSVWRNEAMIHPKASLAPQAHAEMPDAVQVLYSEAGEVMAVSRRAGAALARATLEVLLRHLLPDASKDDRLIDLIGRVENRVSSELWGLLTVVRHTGNTSLHVAGEPDEVTVMVLDPADEVIAPVLFEAVNDLVDEMIAKPKRAASILERLPEGVREGARRAADRLKKNTEEARRGPVERES